MQRKQNQIVSDCWILFISDFKIIKKYHWVLIYVDFSRGAVAAERITKLLANERLNENVLCAKDSSGQDFDVERERERELIN